MRRKFTILLFGLLLAVGWTTDASAQALPEGGLADRLGLTHVRTIEGVKSAVFAQKKNATSLVDMPVQVSETTSQRAPRRVADTGPNSVVKNKAYYQQFPYSYTGDDGVHHSNVDPTEEAKDPHQIYQLLRWVYGNPNFPGPTYSAYTPNFVQEDPVVYGPIAGGWNITAADGSTNTSQTITITTNNTYAFIDSIVVKSGETVLTNYGGVYGDWNSSTYAAVFPTGWSASPTAYYYVDSNNQVYSFFYMSGGGTITITIPNSALQDNPTVEVMIEGLAASTSYTSTITVNNGETWNLSDEEDLAQHTWNITFDLPEEDAFVQGTVQAPYEDGYTALIVSLYNDTTKIYNEPSAYEGSWEFTDSTSLINYIRDNIQSVKLLTDGLRIGSREDHTIGTVFSCDGTYNRFFLLGKGQARKKAPQLETNIANGYWPSYCGEEGPFKTMFEQFSPTSGAKGSDITDFYSKLNEGNVYNVVHDCASVIQNKHQFSMSGRTGTQAIALTGLNFFIPDYRLLWWKTTDPYGYGYTVDGRDMVAYIATNEDTGQHTGYQFRTGTNIYEFAAWFGQYNQDFAPKMGLYKINLEATAVQVAQVYEEGNLNYEVTLTWVSSLNQMSGHEVPQTYTVYYWDPETGEQKYVVAEGITDGKTGLTTVTYRVEQKQHSYTIDYIVEGTPDDNDHPQFVAVSNIDGVVIPGWDDFVGLVADHHESDFVTADMANWYRNFVAVVNEDLFRGLTVSSVTGYNEADPSSPLQPMNTFNLYRYKYHGDVRDPEMKKVATLELFNATPTTVRYKVTYDDDGSNAELEDQNILAPKYQREAMGIKDEGEIRVRGNGDLVIWPNGYYVNFKSITVKNGNSTVTSWTSSQNSLTNGWIVSPGSKWEKHTTNTGDVVAYMEGGGYIAIPNMMQYNNLSVEIVAYTDGGNVGIITVNDKTQSLTNTSATYTWTNLSPNALNAPKRATSINLPIEVTDYITYSNCGATSTTYNTFSGKSLNSGAVLAGNTARAGNSTSGYSIQSNSNSNRGLVTTASGGKVKSVKITVANGTNTIQVYGKNSAYSSAADLYSNNTSGTLLGSVTSTGTITVNGDYEYIGIRSSSGAIYMSSIEVTWAKEETPAYDNLIDDWDYNVDGATMPTGWTLTPGSTSGSSGLGNGDNHNSVWINTPGYITIPASICDGYEDIKVVVMYGTDPTYTGSSSFYVTLNGNSQSTTSTIPFITYEWSNVDASNGITIAPSNGWLSIKSIRVYGTSSGDNPPTPTEGGSLRMHLVMVDQLKEAIPSDNNHPDAYEYVLRYEPNGPNGDGVKESGTAKFDIEKTTAKVNGYYTKAQIDNDTNEDTTLLTLNILDAQVRMDLKDDNPNILYFEMMGAPMNTIPNDYLTKLQYMKNIKKYEEMLESSPNHGDKYDPAEVHYYFYEGTPETGLYVNAQGTSDWKAYAPMVSTWGIDRRYFEDDGENNTYGAPIWKTSVGDVQILGKPAIKKQVINAGTPQEAENPYTTWTVGDQKYCLYFMSASAQGILPNPNVTNVKYVPYMFRVFVESPTGKLRKYSKVLGEGGGYVAVDAGPVTGKVCVGSFYENDCWKANDLFFNKGISEVKPTADNPGWDGNMIFGAQDGLTKDDVKVYVRFYYMVDGWNARGGEARPGNGAEGSGDPDDPTTFIYEYEVNADVVGVTYFNAQGMKSDKPFDGVNIVVTRYSDGSTTTTKVMR